MGHGKFHDPPFPSGSLPGSYSAFVNFDNFAFYSVDFCFACRGRGLRGGRRGR